MKTRRASCPARRNVSDFGDEARDPVPSAGEQGGKWKGSFLDAYPVAGDLPPRPCRLARPGRPVSVAGPGPCPGPNGAGKRPARIDLRLLESQRCAGAPPGVHTEP